jgi:DNA-binding beta-propeller fold protein YncE
VYVIAAIPDTATISDPVIGDFAYVDTANVFVRDEFAWLKIKGSSGGGSDIKLIDDVRTWSYSGRVKDVNSEEANPQSVALSIDGTKMYVIGTSGDDVNEYALSTPYNVASAAFTGVTIASGETGPSGLAFKPDGSKMYVVGPSLDRVREFTLGTPWVLSTATFTAQSEIFTSVDSSPRGLFFKPDGSKAWMCGDTGGTVDQFTLSTPWDVTTMAYEA